MKKTTLASLVGLLFAVPTHANEAVNTDDVIVTASRIPYQDKDATYASEVYDRKAIDASKATTLYEYLAQHTSLLVMPSFGNKSTPLFDMRGYGIGNGFQNTVITVDGQRLNNIDLSAPLIGNIPLEDVERIEITKGSGSVGFGDGAMAGAIQITTKTHNGVHVNAWRGNHGALGGGFSAGFSENHFEFSANAHHDGIDGTSKADATGHRDNSINNSQQAKFKIMPVEALKISLEGSNTHIDTRYISAMTLAQFKDDPRQSYGTTYNHQIFDDHRWVLGGEYALTSNLKLTVSHNREDKLSDFKAPFTFTANYDYETDDAAIQYQGEHLDITAGLQTFDGTRIGSSNRTSKDNKGVFLQTQYRLTNDWAVSAGVRREKVEYTYNPNTGAPLKDSNHLSAWDIGVSHGINDQTSIFANYNHAYQAPDIDRFFDFGGTFNAFISPAKSNTVNAGMHHTWLNHQLKLTAFHSRLNNEIYYDAATFTNTNIDRSHKYGLEIRDRWQVLDNLSASVIYNFTRAIIDHEDRGNGTYDGKDLPGVPKHGVNLSINYAPIQNASINLSHVWRSSSYAADDFANAFQQKQAAYQSTNIAASYRYKNLEGFASIENIFEHKNGLWIRDDAIYPVDFSRNFKIGFKADF